MKEILIMFVRRLRFWCTAKNRHGVHSPFVYQLNERCFNDMRWYPEYEYLDSLFPDLALFFSDRQLQLFFRLTRYLKSKSYGIWDGKKTENPKDIIVLKSDCEVEDLWCSMSNDTMLWVHQIHKENKDLWRQIKEDKRVSVSIDLYRQGLIFIRKEQQKEHFKIRLLKDFW